MTALIPELILPDALRGRFTVRPSRQEDSDFEQIAHLWTASEQVIVPETIYSTQHVREELTPKDFDPEKSHRVIVNDEGKIIADVVVSDDMIPPVRNFLAWNVLPEYRNQGIEEALITWGEARAHLAIERCPAEAEVVLQSFGYQQDPERHQIFMALGYEVTRNFYLMKIDMAEEPAPLPLADGFSIRTYRHPDDLVDYVQTRIDCFRDHYGFVEQPFEKSLADTKEFYETDYLFDQTLCFLAIENATGRIAGMSMCRIEEWGNPNHSYVMTVGTRREYRGKKIASALLTHSFREFWARGRRAVTLHVDGASLTGAVGLYQGVGMHVAIIENTYQKVLRAGKSLMRTELD